MTKSTITSFLSVFLQIKCTQCRKIKQVSQNINTYGLLPYLPFFYFIVHLSISGMKRNIISSGAKEEFLWTFFHRVYFSLSRTLSLHISSNSSRNETGMRPVSWWRQMIFLSFIISLLYQQKNLSCDGHIKSNCLST